MQRRRRELRTHLIFRTGAEGNGRKRRRDPTVNTENVPCDRTGLNPNRTRHSSVHEHLLFGRTRDGHLLDLKLDVDGRVLVRFGGSGLQTHGALQTGQLLWVDLPHVPRQELHKRTIFHSYSPRASGGKQTLNKTHKTPVK